MGPLSVPPHVECVFPQQTQLAEELFPRLRLITTLARQLQSCQAVMQGQLVFTLVTMC